jgi:hypothetical protein
MTNPTDPTREAQALADIARRIEIQADCLDHYAVQSGHPVGPLPSVFHLQSGHFRELARELRIASQSDQHSTGGGLVEWPDLTDLQAIGEALGLFPSAIKSGENWSGHCETVLTAARAALNRIADYPPRALTPTKVAS